MLNSKDLLLKAIENFPRWMDIRKRYFSSDGGQLLNSYTDEAEKVQLEIDEYVKQFFIPYYENKCEIIPDIIYKANIGIVETKDLSLVTPALKLTTSLNEFYLNNLAYYQDGFIFIKNNINPISYYLDKNLLTAPTEKMHVWNAYDEFAVFVGIRRYENETNRELYNRIIYTATHIANSSEVGLKNAIVSSLINIVPELEETNILFERPTPENLVKYYNEFETILDKLTFINKDILRTKKWDVDKWNNEFKDIDYIPHIWDIALSDYINGIGDNDDLKPYLITPDLTTSANISFYDISEENIDYYIKNKDIKDELNLSLMKYNNTLEPYVAKYTITASDALEIISTENTLDMVFDLYEAKTGNVTKPINELIKSKNDLQDIEIINPGKLKTGKYYRVKFIPKDKYSSIEIYNCYGKDEYGNIAKDNEGNIYDFKDETEFFRLDGNTLKNYLVKKYATKESDFNYKNNIKSIKEGMTIEDISKSAELVLNIDNCANESLKLFYDVDMTKVALSNITMSNFFYNPETDSYMSNVLDEAVILNITLPKANQVSFITEYGQCNIQTLVNGVPQEGTSTYSDNKLIYETPKYNTPQRIEVIISGFKENPIKITNLMYSCYEFNVFTSEGQLVKSQQEADLYTTPDINTNNLNISMRTYTQYSPIIKKIFIGTPLTEANTYTTGLIEGRDDITLVVNSNCMAELYESENKNTFDACRKNDPEQRVTLDYSTNYIYKGISDSSYIILDTSRFNNIENMSIAQGTYEMAGYGNSIRHTIKLKKGEQISEVTILGNYDSIIASKTFNNLISYEDNSFIPYATSENNYAQPDKIYINKIFKKIIIEKSNGEQREITLSKKSFGISDEININKISISNMPDYIQAAFVSIMPDGTEYVSIGSNFYGSFKSFYLFPKLTKTYVAKNESILYADLKDNIDIVNTFNNGYEPNKLMLYQIEADNPQEVKINFNNNKKWTINKKPIRIEINEAVGKNFNTIKKVITEDIKLENTVELKRTYLDSNRETIELDQYIIQDNPNYKVIYKYDYNNTSYIKAEYITIENDGFNKLKYSNVVKILYIGDPPNIYGDFIGNKVEDNQYTLDNKKGIIIWNNPSLVSKQVYVEYIISKAVSIKFNMDYLYKKIQYPIDAYKKMGEFQITNIKNGDKLDLSNPILGNLNLESELKKLYENHNTLYVSFGNPNFKAEKDGSILTFKFISEDVNLALRTGWYYLFGREYYLFSTDQSKDSIQDEYVNLVNASKSNDTLYLHKDTSNYIRNSKMSIGSMGQTYGVEDFSQINNMTGASCANAITACNSYNNWLSFATNFSLEPSYNDIGLKFTPQTNKDIDYSMLDITDYLLDYNHISFYALGNIKTYIGLEQNIADIKLNDTVNISLMGEINRADGNIRYTYLSKEPNYRYYLIVRGEGIIDDIIIQDGTSPDFTLHNKNVKSLGFDLEEMTSQGTINRLILDSKKGQKNNNAEVNGSGYIVTASNIDWGVTKIRSYNSYFDFTNQCVLRNADIVNINDIDCVVTTNEALGNLTTYPIYISEPETIKKIIYKVNDVPLEKLKGFNMKLLQSPTIDGTYVECAQQIIGDTMTNYINKLTYPYIKLSIDIPQNKVINNIDIYAEYKSTNATAPKEILSYKGYFTSKVFDTHSSNKYKVKELGIEDIQFEAGVRISVRASRERSRLSVWTDWKVVYDDSLFTSNVTFDGYRFFQIKVDILGKNSKIKLKYIDLEVVN